MGLNNLRSGSQRSSKTGLEKGKEITGNRHDYEEERHSKGLQRKQQKFQKKLQFYSKVKDTVASLGAKKSISKKKRIRNRQKKLKAYDLTSLSEFLPDLNSSRQQPPDATSLRLSCKTRQKLVEKEGKQLKAVLAHPAFQLDPLAAIHQHILNTQPPDANQGKPEGKIGKKVRKGKKGSSFISQSMDI